MSGIHYPRPAAVSYPDGYIESIHPGFEDCPNCGEPTYEIEAPPRCDECMAHSQDVMAFVAIYQQQIKGALNGA